MQRRPLALIALLMAGATTPVVADPSFSPGKIPVLIVPGEVTINGEPRADLGRSFADTIAGGLLRTGSFTIIESAIAKAASAGEDQKPPEEIAAANGGGAHYAFIPRMVVEEDFNRLTLKKIRISDGEVVDFYTTTASNLNRSAMFELLDDTMKLVYADISRDRSRLAQIAREDSVLDPDPKPIPALTGSTSTMDLTPPEPVEAEPAPRRRGVIEDPPTPKLTARKPAPKLGSKSRAKPSPKPEKATKPVDVSEAEEATEVAEYAGRLRAVNTDWHFCIIEVAKRGMLKVDDELLVHGSTSLQPLGKLRVSKVEGSQVVADALDVPLDQLRPGFKVYRWGKK